MNIKKCGISNNIGGSMSEVKHKMLDLLENSNMLSLVKIVRTTNETTHRMKDLNFVGIPILFYFLYKRKIGVQINI
jgi:hypothetical protein